MTGLEVPVFAMVGILGSAATVGGAYAVTKHKTAALEKDVLAVEQELADHKVAHAVLVNEILRSLGRIEGKLEQMERGKNA